MGLQTQAIISFPKEIWGHISQELSEKDYINLRTVCKLFHSASFVKGSLKGEEWVNSMVGRAIRKIMGQHREISDSQPGKTSTCDGFIPEILINATHFVQDNLKITCLARKCLSAIDWITYDKNAPSIDNLTDELKNSVTDIQVNHRDQSESGEVRRILRSFPCVRTITVYGESNFLTDLIITSIDALSLKRLTVMDPAPFRSDIIRRSHIKGTSFDQLPSTIAHLCFYKSQLDDAAIATIAHLKNLKELLVQHSHVTGSTFNKLPDSIERLDCASCGLDDAAIASMAHLKNLKKLDIVNNPGISGLTFGRLPHSIEKINCANCRMIDDQGIAAMAHLKNLKKLDISRIASITGSTFDRLPDSIEKLKCMGCDVDDTAIAAMARLKNLKVLMIKGNHKITGSTFDKLPDSIEKITCEHWPRHLFAPRENLKINVRNH
ncbi:MAG: hypothetical protein JSR46_03690 [Verrucomicrobia bacterium]|nr:hypothetical protein [Verrucomicrobiota bacterium]